MPSAHVRVSDQVAVAGSIERDVAGSGKEFQGRTTWLHAININKAVGGQLCGHPGMHEKRIVITLLHQTVNCVRPALL